MTIFECMFGKSNPHPVVVDFEVDYFDIAADEQIAKHQHSLCLKIDKCHIGCNRQFVTNFIIGIFNSPVCLPCNHYAFI
jgi:hypothetical protein